VLHARQSSEGSNARDCDFAFRPQQPVTGPAVHAACRIASLRLGAANPAHPGAVAPGYAALALLPDHRVTHFAWPVRLPANCPALLRVTAPKLRPDELVDRLVLTSVHLPRRHRIAGLARRQRRLQGHRMPVPAKLAAYGVISGLPPDKVLIDIGDKLHGTGPLAQSIYDESQAYEASSSKCNWVNSQPGVDWKTGQPSNPVYVWSDKTKDNLGPPLRSAAAAEQNDPGLENQRWSAQAGSRRCP
jgi:hypothetical protein